MNAANFNIEMVNRELSTIRDYLRWGLSQFNVAKLFYGHGTDNAQDDLLHLILATLNLPYEIEPDLLSANLTTEERHKVSQFIVERITKKIPTAYLTQKSWFAGLPFYVDERVIIPRSPIAELITNGFSPWLLDREVKDILDLCTGSACIAIACAYAFPESKIDAIELSDQALEVAKLNVAQHELKQRVTLIQSDLFAGVPQNKQYDLIISNPPYVSRDEYVNLPEEYHHEPQLALEAGEDGLMIVEKILRQASVHLKTHGILVVEVGSSQEALIEKYPDFPFLWLEFSHGGEGVFLLTAEQLSRFNAQYG